MKRFLLTAALLVAAPLFAPAVVATAHAAGGGSTTIPAPPHKLQMWYVVTVFKPDGGVLQTRWFATRGAADSFVGVQKLRGYRAVVREVVAR